MTAYTVRVRREPFSGRADGGHASHWIVDFEDELKAGAFD